MINATSMDALAYAPQVSTSLSVEEPTDIGVGIVETKEETNSDVVDLSTKSDEDISNGEMIGKGLKNFLKDTIKAPFTNKDGKFSLGKTVLTVGFLAAGVLTASPIIGIAAAGIVAGGAINQGLNS